ncbi:MAG: hypothetical protein WBG57_06810 [Ornithinimicrobium sp.]
MRDLFLAESEGEHHVVNELLFEPIWFGVITAVVFVALLAFLWSFRNTLALDPHTEHDEANPDTAAGQYKADGGSEPITGQASKH